MTSEMISGPDLGGGFLFQLTSDHEGSRHWFTYHAQAGGDDAGGPPKGDPAPLDYLATTESCQFGGPRCWHRPFVGSAGDTLRVRVAYNRMRFVMAVLIDQLYDSAPVPFESSVQEFVERGLPELARVRATYCIEGPAARWVSGQDSASPSALTVQTTAEGVDRLAELWSDYLIEPQAWTEVPERGTVYGASAFLGSVKAGTRVRWFSTRGEDSSVGGSCVSAGTGGRSVNWKGMSLQVRAP